MTSPSSPALSSLHTLPVMNDRQHLAAVRASLPISLKLRLRQLLIRGIRRLLRRSLPRSLGECFLLVHRMIKTGPIKRDSLIACRILHEVERHAERVVKLECILACKLLGRVLEQCLQFFKSDFHRVCEPCLFRQHRFRHALRGLIQLRIRIPHQIPHRKHHLIEKRLRLPQQPSMGNRAPDDLPQHISAPFIRRQDSVGNQERCRPRVVGDNPQRSR